MNQSFTFTHAICRKPAPSVVDGLRANDVGNPDFDTFAIHHQRYVEALRNAHCEVTVLEALDTYPDSVFIEDAALCLAGTAIALRPGAKSRFGEAAALMPDLQKHFRRVVSLPGDGFVDGGDVLVTDTEVFIGLSERTNRVGFENLSKLVSELGYSVKEIHTPPGVLHFKSDCGLIDSKTIFVTPALNATGCFSDYNVIETPANESAAANLIRVNDTVFISEGYPATKVLLEDAGYKVVALPNSEAEKVDGGLSCMSLRFAS